MEFISACFIIILSMVVVIYQVHKRKFEYWKTRGVYAQSPEFPFGNAKNLLMQKWTICTEFSSLYNHFKERSLAFGGYYFLYKPIFVTVDLDMTKRILITDFEYFTDHSIGLQEFDPMGRYLFAMKGSQWKTMRTKLTPAFTASKNKMLFGTVLKCTEQLLLILDEAADNNRKVEVTDLASRFSMDVIASCMFGIECNSLKNPNSKFRSIAVKMLKSSIRNAVVFTLVWMCPSILELFKIKMINEEVSQFFLKLMKQTVAYRDTNGISRPDFVQLLLQIRDSLGSRLDSEQLGEFTIEEITAQTINFFFAGYETSSLTIMYCLYELATNAEIQSKVREEVQKNEEEQLSYNLIQGLTYLEQVVYETLRKYPPLPFLTRECTKDYEIPKTNVKIEKGCAILIPTLGIHRDPDIYPNPEEFDPERFSSSALKNRPSWAFMPFGCGPRTCVAYQFGLMEIKITIASLIRRYKFTVNPEMELPLKFNPKRMLLNPANSIWLNFEKL